MSHLCMSHQVDLLVCKKIKFTLIQTPSLSFMYVLLRRLGQSVGWDMNLPSMISPHSTKSCTPSRVCCSNMGICAPIPPFPTQRFSDSWGSYAALCESNWWTERRGLISKLQPQACAASSQLWALNSSEKIPVKNMYGKFKQAARHAVSIWSTNVIHEKGWRNRGFT